MFVIISPCLISILTVIFCQLVELDLSRNFLSGDIEFISNLPMLQTLRLNNNQLKGTMHLDIFRFIEGLRIFEIESNYIHGSIPSTFGMQRNLQIFRVSNNEITGFLPQEMCRHINLKIFMASHNKLRGQFPPSFPDCVDLEVLILSHNQFQHKFPDAIASFTKLKILALDHNEFYGSVPSLQALKNLEVLWLHSNRFTESVAAIVNKDTNTKLQDLRFGNNYFECDVYHDNALIHTDSPTAINAQQCNAKTYVNETGHTIAVPLAIP